MKSVKPYLLLIFLMIPLITAFSIEKDEIKKIKALSFEK
jgi:hypothetical protein